MVIYKTFKMRTITFDIVLPALAANTWYDIIWLSAGNAPQRTVKKLATIGSTTPVNVVLEILPTGQVHLYPYNAAVAGLSFRSDANFKTT